jgi:hypothetical protein
VWQWFNSNASQLQSVAALSGVVVTLVSIIVLFVTWRAIKRQAVASELQADAARALTRVAEEQTKAAIDAAQSSRRQADLLARQYELNTAPLLVGDPFELFLSRQGLVAPSRTPFSHVADVHVAQEDDPMLIGKAEELLFEDVFELLDRG